jgi:hypothetical protein
VFLEPVVDPAPGHAARGPQLPTETPSGPASTKRVPQRRFRAGPVIATGRAVRGVLGRFRGRPWLIPFNGGQRRPGVAVAGRVLVSAFVVEQVGAVAFRGAVLGVAEQELSGPLSLWACQPEADDQPWLSIRAASRGILGGRACPAALGVRAVRRASARRTAFPLPGWPGLVSGSRAYPAAMRAEWGRRAPARRPRVCLRVCSVWFRRSIRY